jgi:hypothetical protein
MKKTLLLLMLLSFSIIQAQLVFQDDFSSYIVNQELSGQGQWSNNPIAPNVGIGACLPLSATEPCTGTKVVAQPLSYLNYGASSNSIVIASVQDGVARAINPIIANGDLYVGLVLNLTSAPITSASPVDFLRIINSDPTMVACRVIVRDAGFGYQVGIRKGASNNATAYTSDIYNYGESVLVIIKYSNLDGPNDDTVSLFVNPDYNAGEPATPSAITSTGFDQNGAIDRLAFRLNYNVAASMPTGFAGLVSVSTSWNELTFESLNVDQFESNEIIISSILDEGIIKIKTKNALTNAQVKVTSLTGSLLETLPLTIPSGNSQIALQSKLETGIYLIQITEENGQKNTFKTIVK